MTWCNYSTESPGYSYQDTENAYNQGYKDAIKAAANLSQGRENEGHYTGTANLIRELKP